MVAWLLTLPAAAAIGAATYGVTRIFGTGALGPVLVTLAALALVIVAFARARATGRSRPGRLMAVVVETKELLETVVASLVAGSGHGRLLGGDLGRRAFRRAQPQRSPGGGRRRGRLGLLAVAGTLGAVTVGIIVMANN